MADFNLESATPYSLKYSLSGAGTGQITRTQMIADAHNGPLKTLMQASLTVDWATMANGPKASLYLRSDNVPAKLVGGGLGFIGEEVMVVDGDGGLVIIELRYIHSFLR